MGTHKTFGTHDLVDGDDAPERDPAAIAGALESHPCLYAAFVLGDEVAKSSGIDFTTLRGHRLYCLAQVEQLRVRAWSGDAA